MNHGPERTVRRNAQAVLAPETQGKTAFKGTLQNPNFFFHSIMDFRPGFKGRICFVVIFVGNGKSGRAEKRGRLLQGLSPNRTLPFRRGARRDTRNVGIRTAPSTVAPGAGGKCRGWDMFRVPPSLRE